MRQWISSHSRTMARLIAGLVLIPAAAIANGAALVELARGAGWPAWTPFLLPLAIDGLVAVAMFEWKSPQSNIRAAREFGKWVALSGIAISAVGAALGHLISSDRIQPGIALIVGVGTLPALALAAFIELLVLGSGTTKRTARVGATQSAKAAPAVAVKPEPVTPQPSPKPAELADDGEPQPVQLHSVPTGESLDLDPEAPDREWVVALNQQHVAETGRPIGRTTLQRRLREQRKRGMNSDVAAQLLREVKEATG